MIEICCADTESILAARRGGADRIELCSALSEGGLTPSIAMIERAVSTTPLIVHVLIRPRRGDFVYTTDEIDIMEHDIIAARHAGADGVVIGALLPDGEIDIATTRRLVAAAKPMYVTFHRAFDLCRDPQKALEQIIEAGCHGLLTSGCAPSALHGVETLAKLREQANGRLQIIAAAGINSANVAEIISCAHPDALHASASHTVGSSMTYRNPNVSMGGDADEYTRRTTSADEVTKIVETYKSTIA